REIGHAAGIVLEPRIGGELRIIKQIQELEPGPLVRGTQVEPSILRLEGLVGGRERMRGTQWARRDAGRESDGRLPVGVRDAGLEERGVDLLALTRLELVRVSGADAHCG